VDVLCQKIKCSQARCLLAKLPTISCIDMLRLSTLALRILWGGVRHHGTNKEALCPLRTEGFFVLRT